MNRRTPHALTLTMLLSTTVFGSAAYTQEMFKLLGAKEIRARVVGKDITDNIHLGELSLSRRRTPQR